MNIVKLFSYFLKHSQPDFPRLVLQAVRLLYNNCASLSGFLMDECIHEKHKCSYHLCFFVSKCDEENIKTLLRMNP